MTTWRVVAALTVGVLAVPTVGVSPAAATQAGQTVRTSLSAATQAGQTVRTSLSTATQAGRAERTSPAAGAPVGRTVPCPRPAVKPPPGRPPRPVPPPDDPASRAIGGDALATDGLTVPAGAPRPPALTATSWLVADLDTGEVLGGCGPHVYGTPASVQKLLLAATAMPHLKPDQVVQVTPGDLDIEPGSSAVGLVLGGRYTVRTLWLGLLLNSGNDAANALARVNGGKGGLPATVAAMNEQAKRLGAYQTHAVTPSGLDGPGQFTSAYDLALIARVCFAQPDFRRYVLTRNAQLPAQPKARGFQFQNENRLIFNYPGALGGKTGFTKLARHSYVGAAQRGGRRLVATLLGAEANPQRGWQQGAALLDWGFSVPRDSSVGRLVSPDDGTSDDRADAPATSALAGPQRAVAARVASKPAAGLQPPMMAVAVAVALAAAPVVLLAGTRRRRVRRRLLRRRG